jgi:hypothetical protein
LQTLFCHPGLEPGSIVPTHVLLMNGPRLKAGMTARSVATIGRSFYDRWKVNGVQTL